MEKSVLKKILNEVKTPYEIGPVLTPSGISGDFDSALTDNANIFVTDEYPNKFFMTYVGHDGKGYRTGIAESDDLLFWKKSGVILKPDNDTEWNSYNTAGYIIRDHIWGEVPKAHRLADGSYAMSFFASDTAGYELGIKRAGIAFCDRLFDKNGIPNEWKKHNKPVLEASPECAEYEKGIIWKMQVIFDSSSGKYMGFYNAGTMPEVMCGVTSNDLFNWKRIPTNPLVDVEVSPSGEIWGNTHNGDADVVKIGDKWVMFYFSTTPIGIIDTFAVSDDLKTFEKSFIPLTALNESYANIYAHKPCVFKKNGVVYHFYNAVGSMGRLIAVNTSVDLSSYYKAKKAEKEKPQFIPYIKQVKTALTSDNSSIDKINEAILQLKIKMGEE